MKWVGGALILLGLLAMVSVFATVVVRPALARRRARKALRASQEARWYLDHLEGKDGSS